MILPPKAGRVCSRYLFSLSMARPVQSAVRPVCQMRCYSACQVPAEPCGADEQYFRGIFLNKICATAQVGFCPVVFQDGCVYEIDLISPVSRGLVRQVLNITAEYQGRQFHPEVLRKLLSFSEELPGDRLSFAIHLLHIDPDAPPQPLDFLLSCCLAFSGFFRLCPGGFAFRDATYR